MDANTDRQRECQKQNHHDDATNKLSTENPVFYGLANTDLSSTKGTAVIGDWSVSRSSESPSSTPTPAAIKTHLNGLKPIVIEPHIEKTNWKRRVTLKLLLITACVLFACVAFAGVAYQYRHRQTPEAVLDEDDAIYKGNTANTEQSAGWKQDYYSESSYSSLPEGGDVYTGNLNSNNSVDGRIPGRIALEDIDLRNSNIRLVGGSNQYEGRVEIKRNGVWGTICHRSWNRPDGRVVCRQLGYGDVVQTYKRAHFGQGSGSIWFSKFACSGSEANLYSCTRTTNIGNCRHSIDASVKCQAPSNAAACDSSPCKNGASCTNYNGGTSYYCTCAVGWTGQNCLTNINDCAPNPCQNGGSCDDRVAGYECQCANNYSGTNCQIVDLACDNNPCRNGATCTNTNGGSTYSCTCDVGWTGLNCGTNINDCAPNPCQNGGSCDDRVAGYECQCQSGFSGTTCQIENPNAVDDRVRLVGGSGPFEGRVEVKYLGSWGTVCDDDWDIEDANVVCRSLGYSGAYHATKYAAYGSGDWMIFMDNVDCSGNEDSLVDCPHRGWSIHDCTHNEDAGVSCLQDDWVIPDVTVRLVGGTAFAGRVEVWRNGVWGTIYDDHWGMEEATVVCRQLGYTSAVVGYNWGDSRYSQFGENDGQMWLDDMQCFGSETSIEDCPHAGWANNNCVHDLPFSEQAGVMCYDPSITAKNDLLDTGNCGTRPLVDDRIVGGTPVVDRRPWMGSLRDSWGNHRCGTSLISSNWAITAAHCDDVAYKVYFGDLQLAPQSATHQESTVQVFRNPNYNSYSIDNDFTLLKLNSPITINDDVRPLCLAVDSNEESIYPDGTCKAVGWGHTEWEGTASRDLLEVDLDIITKTACLQVYGHITDNMICTDDPGKEAGTCQGDSGGPLQCKKDGVYHLVGATSHGYECGGPGIPDVFARVSRYWQFIKQTIDMNGGP